MNPSEISTVNCDLAHMSELDKLEDYHVRRIKWQTQWKWTNPLTIASLGPKAQQYKYAFSLSILFQSTETLIYLYSDPTAAYAILFPMFPLSYLRWWLPSENQDHTILQQILQTLESRNSMLIVLRSLPVPLLNKPISSPPGEPSANLREYRHTFS